MADNGAALVHFGAFEADLATGELRRNGRTVKLQPQPFKLLALLLERPGELVTRDEIRRRLWGDDTFVDFEQGLNFAVKKIRDALNDDADRPRYIETLPRRGYRFIAPLERVGRTATAGESLREDTKGPFSQVVSISEGLTVQPESVRAEVGNSGAWVGVAPPDTAYVPAGSAALPSAEFAGSPAQQEEQHDAEQGRETAVESRALRQGSALRRWWVGASIAVLGAFTALYLYSHWRSAPKLTDRDAIVLADFTNTTGDPVFDGTLRQGLSAQLEQSPFLNLLSDQRIAQTLTLMSQPKDARLTRELARQVCVRTASAATIGGSIASIGDQYVLGLEAVNCQTGALLAEEQVTADRKEQVLKALGEAASTMRRKLGESLKSIEKYDVPPESATTPSLEALQAYSLGHRAQVVQSDWTAAIPLLQRAVNLDPNFAMAWSVLAASYGNLGERARAAEAVRRAYDLRERVSNRERFSIELSYESNVTGDLEAIRKGHESYAQAYPRAWIPFVGLTDVYSALGEHSKALAAAQKALRLNPTSGTLYANLVIAYLNLNRLDEAKAMAREAQAHKLDSPLIHVNLYLVDFLQHDPAGMEREAAGLADKPGYADVMLYQESDGAAYAGQFLKARELTRRATESAERVGEKETASAYQAEAAVREALVGDTGLARQQARVALALSSGGDAEAMAAVALGMAGDSTGATRLANDLDRRFPRDTAVQFQYLPMIRAAAVLGSGRGSESAKKAIIALATNYELGVPHDMRVNFCPYPVYLRAEAYLGANEGAAAAAEFQKVLDHPGLVVNQLIGALAHLGLGRAYALQAGIDEGGVDPRVRPGSGTARDGGAHRGAPLQQDALLKARIAYQDFLALWKDADPDLPILKQAKREYARLLQ